MKQNIELKIEIAGNNEKRSRGSMPVVSNAMPRKAAEWSSTQKMRLPHKVGLPLGSGGGGDGGAG